VFPENARAELLAGLGVVDWVAVNRWESAVETIHLVRPTVFVKGQEYESEAAQVHPGFCAEVAAIQGIGGRIAFTHEECSSSTAALRRLSAGAG
jgi:bifunctional ADP-heptose synthase (sugar kinase/adenylyltransferase)